MAGPVICVLCLADTCTSEVKSCRTWIGLDITRFCEQQHQPSSGSACPKNGSTQFAQQLESAVTAPPLVGCVVWRRLYEVPMFMSFLGFDMGIAFANFHVCGQMLLFNAILYMLVRYASPIDPICFRYLMFNLF